MLEGTSKEKEALVVTDRKLISPICRYATPQQGQKPIQDVSTSFSAVI